MQWLVRAIYGAASWALREGAVRRALGWLQIPILAATWLAIFLAFAAATWAGFRALAPVLPYGAGIAMQFIPSEFPLYLSVFLTAWAGKRAVDWVQVQVNAMMHQV